MSLRGGQIKRHLFVDRFHRARPYASQKRGMSENVPVRSNPKAHGRALAGQVSSLQRAYNTLAQTWEGREDIRARGISVEFESAHEVPLNVERFEREGLELLNERDERNAQGKMITKQTWFVPDGKLNAIADVLNDYLTKTRTSPKTKKRIPNYRSLVEAIERISQAAVEQLWTEHGEAFPAKESLWFEVWLRGGAGPADREAILKQFRELGTKTGLRVGKGRINLPEHTIVAARGIGESFMKDLALLNCIAEIRRGRDYADFFTGLSVAEQAQFAKDLAKRTEPADIGAPYIGVLDTGIGRGHPLLEALVPASDSLTIDPTWGSADDDDHGTAMAGLCLFGDLSPVLSSAGAVKLPVHIESVKIVPPPAQRGDDEKLAGFYTAQGVAIAETNAPERKRAWCIATTMKGPNLHTPSSWSSELDALACGRDNDGEVRRLFCLSSGNVAQNEWANYPESNFDHQVENPNQAWNALSVGSYTDFTLIQPPHTNYSPLANRGAMAPTNSTSRKWENSWPNKPDVVFEGGNAGLDAATNSTLQLEELMPLSISADFRAGAFRAICGTSPATALTARLAGQILADYPMLWPETVRGLIVHSALWTQAMKSACPTEITAKERSKFLLRTVGYGVPDLRMALECTSSRATLIAQCELAPFKIEKKQIIFNEMHIHALPWPEEELAAHSDETVRLRVTLSYFIEPNPGNRGYTSTYRYPGCPLRFSVSSPGQTEADLEAQVSKIAAKEMLESEGRGYVPRTTDGWVIGQQAQRGSLHSDIWEGTAASLLSMRHIAVYPLTGWWRTRPRQGKADARIKYALIVSIEAQNPSLDVYTEIANQVSIPIEVPVAL